MLEQPQPEPINIIEWMNRELASAREICEILGRPFPEELKELEGRFGDDEEATDGG